MESKCGVSCGCDGTILQRVEPVIEYDDLAVSVLYDEKFLYFRVHKPDYDPETDTIYLPSELLILEVNESAMDREMSRIAQNVAALKAYVVSIAMHGFGEGFTSFYDLQQYPVNGSTVGSSGALAGR